MKQSIAHGHGWMPAAIATLLGATSSANAQQAISGEETHRTINIVYGNAIIGGLVGLATQHGKHAGDQMVGAAAGSVLGALLTRAAEGSRNRTRMNAPRRSVKC
jgi:hypothetical protein